MLNDAFRQAKTAVTMLVVLTLLTGILYPMLITLLAQLWFPHKANGSLVKINNQIVGSSLIGQNFSEEKYFWGRPSATKPHPYNALQSAGSNFGPSNPEYLRIIKSRIGYLKKMNPGYKTKIPIDLITASGSGLDPHISIRAAMFQVARLAKVRNIHPELLEQLIADLSGQSAIYFFAQPKVNVLELNLALDNLGKENEGVRNG